MAAADLCRPARRLAAIRPVFDRRLTTLDRRLTILSVRFGRVFGRRAAASGCRLPEPVAATVRRLTISFDLRLTALSTAV